MYIPVSVAYFVFGFIAGIVSLICLVTIVANRQQKKMRKILNKMQDNEKDNK